MGKKSASGGIFSWLFSGKSQTVDTHQSNSATDTPPHTWDDLVDKITSKKLAEKDKLLEDAFLTDMSIEPGPDYASMPPEQVKWLLQEAKQDLALGNTTKAYKLLEIALSLDTHPEVLFALAKLTLAQGDSSEAARLCLQSLQLFPNNVQGYELLTQLDAAVLDTMVLTQLRPTSVKANTQLARLCMTCGAYSPALDFFIRARSLGLNVDEVEGDLGTVFQRMGAPELAVRHFQRHLERTGNLATAYTLCDIYLDLGQYQAAAEVGKAYFADNQASQARDRWAQVNFLLAQQLAQSGNQADAISGFYLALDLGIAAAKDNLAVCLRSVADENWEDNPAMALEKYEAWLEISGFDVEIGERVAAGYLKLANFGKAIEYWRRLLKLEPENQAYMAALAAGYQGSGELIRAADLWERLIQLNPGNKAIREELFNYCRTIGDYSAARQHLAELYEKQSEKYKTLIQSLLREQLRLLVEHGKLEQAWQVCYSEIKESPSTELQAIAAKILFERLDILAQTKEIEVALRDVMQARQIGLDSTELSIREASLHEQKGNYAAALPIYVGIVPKTAEVRHKIKELYLNAARIESEAGDLPKARHLLEEVDAHLPQDEMIKQALALVYYATGQYTLAVALSLNRCVDDEDQPGTDFLSVLRPRGYRSIILG
ncbi:MAG: hypothetical protein M0Z55_00755 [Peptococcaceae bacterium]|nr:hypothetical protein [Peptococcaceae bacterium]